MPEKEFAIVFIPIETTITEESNQSPNCPVKRAACERNDGLQSERIFLWRQIILKNRLANERGPLAETIPPVAMIYEWPQKGRIGVTRLVSRAIALTLPPRYRRDRDCPCVDGTGERMRRGGGEREREKEARSSIVHERSK